MLENYDFDQAYWSRTAIVIYKIEQDSFRLVKWLIFYDRSHHVNRKYFDLMGSVCKYLYEISQR